MAVSKVGLGWPVGERQFDTLAAWLAALGAGAQEAHCKGDIGTGNVIVNAQPTGTILIRGDVQYAGNNHTALATLTGRLELLTSAHFLEVRDIRTISSGANGGIRLLNTNRALRCYSQHTGDAGFTNGIITGQDIQNCVARSTDGLTQFGIRCFTTGGMIINCVSFGARRAFSGNAAGIVFTRCFGLQSVLQDYQLAGGATRTNSASQDATGNITGYTSAEFVDFANGDYRIKSTSDLFDLNIGAFFEESGTTNYDTGAVSAFTVSSVADTLRNTDITAASSLSVTAIAGVIRNTDITADSSLSVTAIADTLRNTAIGATSSFSVTMTGGSQGSQNYDTGAVSSFTVTALADVQRGTAATATSSLSIAALADTLRNTDITASSSLTVSSVADLTRDTTVSAVSNFTITLSGGDDSDKPVISVIRFNNAIIQPKIRLGAGRTTGPQRFSAGRASGVIRWS